MFIHKVTISILLSFISFPLLAKPAYHPSQVESTEAKVSNSNTNVVAERIEYETEQDKNPFAIAAHEPNYILPYNYTSSPTPYFNQISPSNQKVQRVDFIFQLSLKTPIWRDFFEYCNTLYLAYAQQSFWQSYNSSPFFRANNYQPEIFLENNVDVALPYYWNFQLLNVGAMHQSNGRGGALERSWNRVYIETVFSKENWLVSFKPWLILKDSALRNHNPDISNYLGYGRTLVAYKIKNHVFAVNLQNYIETGFHRGSIQLSYSFPLVKKIKGYILYFNGYGQNLLAYDHKTSAIGVGISLSDWL